MSGGVFFVGNGRVWGKWQIVIRKGLKPGILLYIWLTEGVNGSVKTKLLGQGIGSWSRVGVDRFRMGGRFVGEAEGRACRSARSCENG